MKLVPEHINEVHNFERKQDKMSSLGVGKIHLIKSWLDEMDVTKYIINDDLTIDVKQGVDLKNRELIQLPDYIQFNIIDGNFWIYGNRLVSLKGCPRSVLRNFSCSSNKLNSLEGCPNYVILDFSCHHNNKQFTIDDVKKYCNVKGDIYV